MLNTVGPELQVHNRTGNPIELKIDDRVTITSDLDVAPSAEILPVNCDRLAQVRGFK